MGSIEQKYFFLKKHPVLALFINFFPLALFVNFFPTYLLTNYLIHIIETLCRAKIKSNSRVSFAAAVIISGADRTPFEI